MPGVQLQVESLRAFTALAELRASWEGRLVLSLGLDEPGGGLGVAAHLAGAVTLAVEADSAWVREVVRSGVADFVVSTLDEALRAIKNEIRKRTPITVVLHADPALVLDEALRRGVAPDLFACFGGCIDAELLQQAVKTFSAYGTELLDLEFVPAGDSKCLAPARTQDLVNGQLESRGWSLAIFSASTPAQLREFDLAAIGLLPEESSIRRRWLEGVSRILQRQRPPHRCLWLTELEAERLRQEGFQLRFADELLRYNALGDALP